MRSFNVHNWGYAPHNRASFQDVQSLFPTARIRRGAVQPSALTVREQPIGHIEYPGRDGGTRTIDQLMQDSYSDAFLVSKDGVLLAESYGNGMERDTLHLINSVSKSFLAMLAGILVGEGIVNPDEKVTAYIPEFSRNAFGQSTVRDLLDMTAAPKFGENYDNEMDDFWVEAAVVGWRPALSTPHSPTSLFEYAQSRVEKEQEDGALFHYRTLLTNAIAMVLERATHRPVQDLFEEKLWQKLGCEQDCAIVVDPTGFPYFGAGMNVCARDLVRFGLVLANDGHFNSEQIVPADWIKDTLAGSDRLRMLFAQSDYGQAIPGGHYRNQVWANKDAQVMICIGIHGQVVFVNQRTNVVIVKLSSHPKPADDAFFGDVFGALFTLSEVLE